jgi:hypothetical protein
MKKIKSRKDYKCYQCKSAIPKGSYYTRKSIRYGETGIPGYDGKVHTWEPYRISVEVCVSCRVAAGGNV